MYDLPNDPFQILIVDNNPRPDTLEELLRQHGYIVICTLSEMGTLGFLDQLNESMKKSLDLILLDIMMPSAEGFEVLKQIRSDPSLSDIPVLVLTKESIDYQIQAFNAGANDCISKPFDNQELMARVRALLQVRQTEKRLIRRNEELATLHEIAREITNIQKLDSILESIAEKSSCR